MVPVVPALVVFAAQASNPRYFTNAENVRRIAAGKRFVAFATSGGVRVFERATQQWRVYRQNDGLPTHNIHDVVFDKQKPDLLWVLCGSWGDWASEQPEPNLRLVTLDLASGKVESVAPPTPAPRTARMGYLYFLDYRLSISDGWAFVFTDKGASLVWDRVGKKWSREVSVEPTPARPSVYPGHTATLALAAASDTHLALLIKTEGSYFIQSQVQTLPDGQAIVLTKAIPTGEKLLPHVLLVERQTGRTSRHPLGEELLGLTTVVPGEAGRPTTIVNGGRPLALVPDTRLGAFVIESLGSELASLDSNGNRVVTPWLTRHRVAPNVAQPVVISREKLSDEQVRQRQRNLPRLSPLYATDFLIDGNTLWVAGYNDPNRPRSGGIVKLDLTTGMWEGIKPAETGLPANFINLSLYGEAPAARGSYMAPPTFYAPGQDEFLPTPQKRSSRTEDLSFGVLPDPRVTLSDELERFTWTQLQILGGTAERAIVLGPREPAKRYLRQDDGRLVFQNVKLDTYFFYDKASKKLTPLELRGLEGLQARAAGFGEGALFFLTENKTPAERRGAPVVVRWDTKTGVVKRYPEPLFREVSIAAQRAAGVRQQTDLKTRQKERELLLKRFPTAPPPPPVALRPPMEFLWPLNGSFVKATGTTWLQLDQHLFRYDARQDTWLPEGLADRLSAEGETALWKQAGPEWWRFETLEARRLRGEVSRWTQATGWQKLELGESTRQAGYGLLFHDEALWLTGVGALRLPRSAWIFQK